MKNSWKKLFFIIHPECEELKEWIKNVAKRMRKKKIKKGKTLKKKQLPLVKKTVFPTSCDQIESIIEKNY